MKRQSVGELPREPFSEKEIEQILRTSSADLRTLHKKRLKALVQVLLETGLRIGDAVNLRTESTAEGKLHLRTEKTNTKVYLPLSQPLLIQLECIRHAGGHFFWSGNGKLKSRIGNWQRNLKKPI